MIKKAFMLDTKALILTVNNTKDPYIQILIGQNVNAMQRK